GIRDFHVTGVQTCALPISTRPPFSPLRCLAVAVILLLVVLGARGSVAAQGAWIAEWHVVGDSSEFLSPDELALLHRLDREVPEEIGRASCRERGWIPVVAA